MFSKQKKIEKIQNLNEAIKVINILIDVYEWEDAYDTIQEIKKIEQKSYLELNESLNNSITSNNNTWIQKKIEHYKKEYQNKIEIINKIEKEYKNKKENYDKNIEKIRFKIRFKQIKNEINNLIYSKKANTAFWLLKSFLEENKDKEMVVNFFNKEKKYIQKKIINEKKNEDSKYKLNIKSEALKLIWKTINIEDKTEEKKEEKVNFFNLIKIYKNIRKRIKRKKMLDEIHLLIEENSKIKDDIAKQKLESLNDGINKEISQNNLVWYSMFGKILWAEKLIKDSFWFFENKLKYIFYIWDAAWKWLKASFVIMLMNKLYNNLVDKWNILDLVFNINNQLKQDLKSWNFIHSSFFEIKKEKLNNIKYIWMWQESILLYRKKSYKIDSFRPNLLPIWIRLFKDKSDIKTKDIEMLNGDILFTYSDWIFSIKDKNWKHLDNKKLAELFLKVVKIYNNPKKIYEALIKEIEFFWNWEKTIDDISIIILQRDTQKDIIDNKDEYIKSIKNTSWVNKSEIKKLKWKTIEEIEKWIKELKKEKEIQNIIKILEWLYYTWEILKLKQEAIQYINDWYIDKKINFYLKKAYENEQKYKIDQKEQRLVNKYNVLKELLKKWEYKTVIEETENIVSKDWDI